MRHNQAARWLAPLLAAVAGCSALDAARFTSEQRLEVEAAPLPLAVCTENGWIKVARAEVAMVVIDAHIRALTQQRADATAIRAVNDNGTLVVDVAWAGGQRQRGEGCSLEVTLPAADGVAATTSNGHIDIESTAGPLRAATSNGQVNVRGHSGSVAVQTSNGGVRVDQPGGPVDVVTSNGRVEIDAAHGPVQVRTSNGRVRVALAAEASGPVDLRSSNGSMELLVGPGFGGELKLATSNAGIRIEGLPSAEVSIQKSHGRIVVPGAAHQHTVSTSNGGITVRGTGPAGS